jgi:hypothetical protein
VQRRTLPAGTSSQIWERGRKHIFGTSLQVGQLATCKTVPNASSVELLGWELNTGDRWMYGYKGDAACYKQSNIRGITHLPTVYYRWVYPSAGNLPRLAWNLPEWTFVSYMTLLLSIALLGFKFSRKAFHCTCACDIKNLNGP